VEAALWSAARSLEERASLLRSLASSSLERGHNFSATRFINSADEAEKNANILRKLLMDGKSLNDEQFFSSEQDDEIGNRPSFHGAPPAPE
jgi:two-component system, chemotaxis family, protein-glutamate methylesterase/glutaminase